MEEEYKKKIDQNLQYNKEILEKLEKIHRHVLVRNIVTVIKIIAIAIPLILAVIYLPPYIEQFFNKYQEFLSSFIKF